MKASLNNFFRDKNGNTVIFQKPNLLIYLSIIFFIISKITYGNIKDLGIWGFKITIFIWSIDELIRGDSMFRRILGAITGLLVIYIVLNNI